MWMRLHIYPYNDFDETLRKDLDHLHFLVSWSHPTRYWGWTGPLDVQGGASTGRKGRSKSWNPMKDLGFG